MNTCRSCHAHLANDEIAIYRRLVNRQSVLYLCKSCLADSLGCSVSLIDDKIRHYREQGCYLFPTNPDMV